MPMHIANTILKILVKAICARGGIFNVRQPVEVAGQAGNSGKILRGICAENPAEAKMNSLMACTPWRRVTSFVHLAVGFPAPCITVGRSRPQQASRLRPRRQSYFVDRQAQGRFLPAKADPWVLAITRVFTPPLYTTGK